MSEPDPFAAPSIDRERLDFSWVSILATWGSAGTLAVVAGAALAGADRTWPWLGPSILGGTIAGLALGGAATVAERQAAGPVLVDAWGARSRPVHGWLYALPAWVTCGAGLALGVAAVQRHQAFAAALGCVFVAGLSAVAAIRVTRRHRLARALAAMDTGDVERGLRALRRLGGRLSPPDPYRQAARVNLAMYAISQGQADEALAWCEGVSGGVAGAWGAVIRALATLVRGEAPGLAFAALDGAEWGAEGRAVQAHVDAVRLLALWRTEGAESAHTFAARVDGPDATILHRALLAALRQRAGLAIDESAEVAAFRAGPLGRTLPELSTTP